MPDSDGLQRFIFERARVRGELVRLDATWQEVLRRRDYPAGLRAALGELLAACALLAATIKFEGGTLVLQIQGGAPLQLLVVDCQSDLTLRATAQWEGDLGGLGQAPPLAALAEGGRCALTIHPGNGLRSYQGIVPLEGATATEVLERYMERSEQLETRFFLAADERRAAGVLLQKLPPARGAAPDDDDGLWERAASDLEALTHGELLDTPEAPLLRRLFQGEPLRIFEDLPVRFACRCSPGRVARVLRLIGVEETEALLAERGAIEVTCEFCGERFELGPEEARRALEDCEPSPPPA